MWFMMIVGIIFTATTLSRLVDPYTPQALARAFWIVGGAALVLGLLGLSGLEARAGSPAQSQDRHSWSLLIGALWRNSQARLFFWYLIILLAALLGQDILLEPFAAEAFGMSVKATTRITALWGVFVLVALLVTGWLETRLSKRRVAAWGGWGALAGFVLILASGIALDQAVFYLGVVLLGIGTGVSTVSNLSLMLDMTMAGQVGLFVGAWGMANAISRLLGSVLGGIGRDVLARWTGDVVLAYVGVFAVMAAFLLVSLILLARIDVKAFQQDSSQASVVERAALAGDS
jgi:BCD family chlorophyll transporter-like MFS transporter